MPSAPIAEQRPRSAMPAHRRAALLPRAGDRPEVVPLLPAGIDGEAAVLDPPVLFRVRSGVRRGILTHDRLTPGVLRPGRGGWCATDTAGTCQLNDAHRLRQESAAYWLGCGSWQSTRGLTPT